MTQETKEFIEKWLEKANDDLLVINKLTENEIIASSSVCFHAQQLVEKVLKSFLIANGKEIRKTHNIEFLLSECSDFDNDFMNINPKNLSDFGVEARYPGDMYLPSDGETLEYKKLAIEIKILTENKIRKILQKSEYL